MPDAEDEEGFFWLLLILQAGSWSHWLTLKPAGPRDWRPGTRKRQGESRVFIRMEVQG